MTLAEDSHRCHAKDRYSHFNNASEFQQAANLSILPRLYAWSPPRQTAERNESGLQSCRTEARLREE